MLPVVIGSQAGAKNGILGVLLSFGGWTSHQNDRLGTAEETPVTERTGVGKGCWLAFQISTTTKVKSFCLLVLEIKVEGASS